MSQLNFPDNPINGQLYPNPCPAGVTQYRWDSGSGIWRIVGVATGVTPGQFGNEVTVGQFTVDVVGRLTQASNIPIRQASITQTGIVQLTNSTNSISELTALSARGGKALQDQIGSLNTCIVPDSTNVVAALNDLQRQSIELQTNALVWCGYYNAQEGDISYVSITGQRLGYVIGQELPLPGRNNGGDFFIVTVSGNPYIAGDYNAPDANLEIGNWIVSEVSRWSEVNTIGKIKASDVAYTPSPPLTATDVQGALFQVTQLFRTGIGGATISDEKPSNPYPGQLWWDDDDGIFYIFYTDENSSQWVEVGGGGSQGLGGGGTGTVYEILTGVGLTGGPITTEGTISLKPATSTVIGGIFVPANSGLSLTASSGRLTLSPPTATVIGGVKAGNNITITADGTISSSGGGGGNAGALKIIDNIAPAFNGTQSAFVLKVTGSNLPLDTQISSLLISVGGVNQDPATAFTWNAPTSTITFTSAPAAGLTFDGRVVVNVTNDSGGAGGVTSITFVQPLSGGTITGSGTVGIADASESTSGAMTSAQFTKLGALGTNGNGSRTVSTSQPTGGSNGDIWYVV